MIISSRCAAGLALLFFAGLSHADVGTITAKRPDFAPSTAASPLYVANSVYIRETVEASPELTPALANRTENGSCVFKVRWLFDNLGPVGAENIRITVRRNGIALVDFNEPAMLPKHGTSGPGELKLPDGISTLVMTVDDGNKIGESNESNNQWTGKVKVSGCAALKPQ